MEEVPWYQRLFGEDYLRGWAANTPPERTEREVAAVSTLLPVPEGSRVLDLCCGYGRLTVPLAQRGYRMVGLDLSPVLLGRAREAAGEAGVEVEWVHSDMREIPFREELDAVINIFTSFGYFEADSDNQRVLDQVAAALKLDGWFLIDFIQRERVVRQFRPHNITRLPDGALFLDEARWELRTGRVSNRVTFVEPDGRRTEYGFSVRMYTLAELAAMHERAGLRVEAVYGGLDGGELQLDSPRLVLLSRKEDPSSTSG